MKDWSECLIEARMALRRAEDILTSMPHGNRPAEHNARANAAMNLSEALKSVAYCITVLDIND